MVDHQELVMLREPAGKLYEAVRIVGGRYDQLAFSADGRSLAFVLGKADAAGIYAVEVDANRTPNRLTEDAGDSNPVFAGDEIVYTHHDADGSPHLMRMGRDGSHPVRASARPRLTLASDLGHHRVLIASPDRQFLYWWDPATGRETPGPRLGADKAPLVSALSPGGDWFMFMTGGDAGQEVWRVRTDGKSAPEKVFALGEDVTTVSGAIDDRGHPLLALDTWAGDLWLAPAAAGAAW
jgi:hypothetical protein